MKNAAAANFSFSRKEPHSTAALNPGRITLGAVRYWPQRTFALRPSGRQPDVYNLTLLPYGTEAGVQRFVADPKSRRFPALCGWWPSAKSKPMRVLLALCLIAAGSFSFTPAAAAPPWPVGVNLPAGQPVDEEYRGQFASCDREETFRGHQTHGCGNDPNQVTALRRLPDGSVAYVSKLAVDLDGSAFACGPDHGRSDQCPTSLMLPDGKGGEIPVDADAIPYVVIPEAGPPDVAGEFTRLTGVEVGDLGVVIANGRVVPVIVADTGPFAKLGEGSLALHRALGRELCLQRNDHGVCRRVVDQMESIEGNVTTILFPGTARHDLTPANIARIVREQGRLLWAKATASAGEHSQKN